MPRRSATPPPKQPANLSAQQIRMAIPKLERRLRELQAVSFDDLNPGFKERLDGLHTKLEATLVEVFGADTLDYERYDVSPFWQSVPLFVGRSYSDRETAGYYQKAVHSAIAKVETAIEVLREQLEDLGETPSGRALQVMGGLDLHGTVHDAAWQRYQDGHYADAIEAACKALNNLVQNKVGKLDLEGTDLMRNVFSAKKPLLCFTTYPYQVKSDESEQEGMMHLYEGVMLALRNPRAHKLVEDDPERALEFIAFISLLAKLLDGAHKPRHTC